MSITADDVMIRAPKIARFNRFPSCPACNYKSIRRWQNWLRGLHGKQPIFAFRFRFCHGGKAPTERPPDIPSMIADAIGAPDLQHRCAGIAQQHLHVHCQGCGYEFFMAAKQADLSGI